MIVNLIKAKQMFSVTLPEKVKGRYWITDIDDYGKSRELIGIEAVKGEWILKSNRRVSVLNAEHERIEKACLQENSFFNLKIAGSDERVLIFAETIDHSRRVFQKYVAREATALTIGRNKENQVCFTNRFVSGKHAVLSFDGTRWSISDDDSTNGTYVNGFRVEKQNLEAGDFVYIMGLKIVVGYNFLAMNNPDDMLRITSSSLVPYRAQIVQERENFSGDEDGIEKSYFFRSPRLHREIEDVEIQIDPPPQAEKLETVPMALMLGPSMTMAFTSVSTALLSVNNVLSNGGSYTQALPSMLTALSMLLGTVLWPVLTKKFEKKQKRESEQRRQQKYLAYLDEVRDEIRRYSKVQTDILNTNIVSLAECAERITQEKANLWERAIGHSDFLHLRVGTGTLPLKAELKFQEKRFTMAEDNLQDAMLSLGMEPKVLNDVPISVSLVDKKVVGIVGSRAEGLNMMKALLLQMITLHSYDELKIMLFSEDLESEEWNFVKWIPHFWNDEKNIRFLASEVGEVKELSAFLEKNILSRGDNERQRYSEYSPYYVIISTSKKLQDNCESLQHMLKYKNNAGFSILVCGEELKDLPKETESIIMCSEKESRVFDKHDTTGKEQIFKKDFFNSTSMFGLAEKIANIELDLDNSRYALPNVMTFLEMFHVGRIEHLNSLTRWKENNPTITLQTPIGVGTSGETFQLDLHEKYHGPHGLVAGMTGSGKSEFIITYILSMAVNFHPDEVAFILIDYKGGGLTGAFENDEQGIKLPHLAGTITNLDGSAVKRALISIQSELRRRQAVFNEARKAANEGTMDIYKYQKLYREGIVKEPVPHLFIISDEFAELKTQQPEFMEQLISAARIGRSLGVHLILATQKPSGVVDDQIWSNSKFRVCLKVQEKADSQDMIKCPDAAELSQTGRFYLQVGFNELFALGQSAWCGAPYVPTDVIEKTKDNTIQVVDNLGRVLLKVKPGQKVVRNEPKTKQIVEVVKYLSELANEEDISVRPLWLPPIPSHIYVENLEKKYGVVEGGKILNPVVGEYDDPFNQKQGVWRIPLSAEGNCLVYGSPGNGKSSFLTTMCYSLIKNHSAEEVNIYIMDFGAEILRAFDKAPQVGDVILSTDEEKVLNLLKMLNQEIITRKNLFSDYGGDYQSYVEKTRKSLPNIVVLLNNYAGFAELYEDYQEDFTLMTRDCVTYGIYFIVTASSVNAIRYKVVQNFKQVITMQLNDSNDYQVVLGKTEGLIPARYKGRGLMRMDNVYEFQTAYAMESENLLDDIRIYVKKLAFEATSFARKVPVLPDVVNAEYLAQENVNIDSIPIGVGKKDLDLYRINLRNKVVTPISCQDLYQAVTFVEEFLKITIGTIGNVTVIDSERILSSVYGYPCRFVSSDMEVLVQEMFADMVSRNNEYKDAKLDASVLEKYDEKVFVIMGMQKLFGQLSDDGKEKLGLLIEKAEAIYKMHFIIIETQQAFNSYTYEGWFKRHVVGAEGLWIGDGVADQYLLKINKITPELYAEVGNDYGYLIRRNKPILIKILSSRREEE